MKFLKTLLFSLVFLLVSSRSLAGAPSVMTFQTKIFAPNGSALEASAVNFRFTILDSAGTCILYVEDYSNVNMTSSQGIVSFPLGSGTKTYPPAATSLYEVFNNSAPSFNCQAGGTFTPSGTDNRQVVMQFNDGNGWQTLPQMAINAVPFANYATRAESLGAYVSTDYLRPATLPTCAAGQALTWDGSTFTCVVSGGGGGSTYTGVTSIANASGDITLAPAAGTGSIRITSNTPSTSTTTGSVVITGGMGVSGAINAAGNISTSGSIASTGSILSTTSVFTPQLYGTSTASGNIKVDGTSNATKGNVLLASAGGNVGIGTTSPNYTLHVVSNVDVSAPFPRGAIQVDSEGTNIATFSSRVASAGATPRPAFRGHHSRGTLSSPTALMNGDGLLGLEALGYDGSGWNWSSTISMQASENWGPANHGSEIVFSTTRNATSTPATAQMILTNDGRLGIGTTTPSTKFFVNDNSNYLSFADASGGGAELCLQDNYAGTPWCINQGWTNDSFGFFWGGVNKFIINSSGNIGVGTSSPQYKLDVVGDVNITGSFRVNGTPISAGGGANQTGVTSISNASGDITLAPAVGTGAVQINSGAASTSPTTGALVVSGGVGVSGGIYAGGAISSGSTISAATSMYSPQLYGTSTASGNILIDGTSNNTKGNVLLASAGGKVAIGTTTPGYIFDIRPATNQRFYVNQSVAAVTDVVAYGSNQGTLIATDQSNASNATYLFDGGSGSASIVGTSRNTLNLTAGQGFNGPSSASAQMAIKSTGNIGVGTTSPEKLFHIWKSGGGLNYGLKLTQKNNGGNNVGDATGIEFDIGHPTDSANRGKGGIAYAYGTQNTWSRGDLMFLQNSAADGTEATLSNAVMTITNAGNVGISTTTPRTNLHVINTGISGGTYTGNERGLIIENDGNSNSYTAMRIMTLGARNALNFTNAGNLALGTTTPAGRIHAEAGDTVMGSYPTGFGYYLSNYNSAGSSTRKGLFLKAAYYQDVATPIAQFSTYGPSNTTIDRMSILSSGLVGIGTTTPTANFEIVNSTANTTSIQSSGYSLTGAATTPLWNVSGTWNTTGAATLLKANVVDTASNANSLLMDIQINGASQFQIDKWGSIRNEGSIITNADIYASGTISAQAGIYSTHTLTDMSFVPDNTQGTVAMTLKNSTGNLGLGTTTPQARLDVSDTGTVTSAIIVPRAGNFTGTAVNGMVRYNTSSTLFEFYQNGSWVNYTTVSDGRLKKNVEPVSNGLDLVNQLNPVFYDWDRSNPKSAGFEDKHQVGFIAQEVEKVLPEVVNKGEDSYRSLEYGKIVSVVVAAVKELYQKVKGSERKIASVEETQTSQQKQIEKLKAENAAKDKKIQDLEKRLEKIEKALNH